MRPIAPQGWKGLRAETTLEMQYHAQTVMVTTGTFLKGLMHIGQNQQSGGRVR